MKHSNKPRYDVRYGIKVVGSVCNGNRDGLSEKISQWR